jgi:hypothetical protein
MDQAYYESRIADFLSALPQTVLGYLAEHHAHDLVSFQREAWLAQIKLLQRELTEFPGGWLAFEFVIPRMGKRVDAIIVLQGIIFIVEFKTGDDTYRGAAIDQVTDYALDLKNFHAGSHHRCLVPILIALEATNPHTQLVWGPDNVAIPLLSTGDGLGGQLRSVLLQTSEQKAFDPTVWARKATNPPRPLSKPLYHSTAGTV